MISVITINENSSDIRGFGISTFHPECFGKLSRHIADGRVDHLLVLLDLSSSYAYLSGLAQTQTFKQLVDNVPNCDISLMVTSTARSNAAARTRTAAAKLRPVGRRYADDSAGGVHRQ